MILSFVLILFHIKSLYICNESKENYNYLRNSKLLVILLDGFRWDYGTRDKNLKGFPLIQEKGVHAPYVQPVFPSLSLPNHYSITTGLYVENHGIIDNAMYDPVRKEIFMPGPGPLVKNSLHSHWWNQTEPLWINAEKQGVKTSMYSWVGCQVEISGIRPSLCIPAQALTNLTEIDKLTRKYVKSILDDFSDNKYRLSMLYYNLVDEQGHAYGPDSIQVKGAVRQIDAILYDLYTQIIGRKLDKTLNVVIVSDHGMVSLKGFKKVFLNQTLDINDIQPLLPIGGSLAQIFPKPNKRNKVYKELSLIKGIKVYRKKDIPDKWHYKKNVLVPPIFMIADIGNAIQSVEINQIKNRPDHGNENDYVSGGGGHGFDPKLRDMHGIMYGFGPAFKRNYTSVPLEMVDHYNLFCRLLSITPHPNNGTIAKVKPFLKMY